MGSIFQGGNYFFDLVLLFIFLFAICVFLTASLLIFSVFLSFSSFSFILSSASLMNCIALSSNRW